MRRAGDMAPPWREVRSSVGTRAAGASGSDTPFGRASSHAPSASQTGRSRRRDQGSGLRPAPSPAHNRPPWTGRGTTPGRLMIFVILPAWNEEKVIGPTLRALAGAYPFGARCHAVLVDDGSSDRTVAEAQGAVAEAGAGLEL